MIQKKINSETTIQLIKLCRKEKTTVQGALCAAMMLAINKEISSKNELNLRFSCCSYVDLRRRLKPEVKPENLAVLASAITTLHNVSINTSFWNLARDVRQQLKVGLESEDIFTPVLMSRKIYESYLSRPNETHVTVGVTNVGRVDIPSNYGYLKLEEISFVPVQSVFGGVFATAVTTFQDTMILNFMFSEPSISQEKIELLTNDVICYITNICRDSF